MGIPPPTGGWRPPLTRGAGGRKDDRSEGRVGVKEQILELARAMDGGAPEETLAFLCGAAQEELEGKLKEGLSPEDCGGAFTAAAAWLALSGVYAGGGQEPASWTAGPVSVSGGLSGPERARGLRELAFRMMAPYLQDEGFCFQGVKG